MAQVARVFPGTLALTLKFKGKERKMNDPKFKFLNITVPLGPVEMDSIQEGEEFSWVFHTKEEPNTVIRVRLVEESIFLAEEN